MIRIYILGAMFIALCSAVAAITFSLRSERDAAFERGQQAGRAEVQALITQQADQFRHAAADIANQTDQQAAQLVPLQKNLEDDVNDVSNQANHSNGQCLDRSIVRALNAIGERTGQLSPTP
jgi:hypothetical protein